LLLFVENDSFRGEKSDEIRKKISKTQMDEILWMQSMQTDQSNAWLKSLLQSATKEKCITKCLGFQL